ncbi:MAG: DUF418 domain-containing protein [Ferruginibacter sp.]
MVAISQKDTVRLPVIDIMRGIALFGILIINIQTYTFFIYLKPEQVYNLNLDTSESYGPLQFFISLFFKGEFYTMYSFLFGLGFYLMFRKNFLQGFNSTVIYRRRLWVLLGIGLIHGCIFWFGDVLHKYAVIGFSLLYFNKKPVRVIIKWITALLLLFAVFQVVRFCFFVQHTQAAASLQTQKEYMFTNIMELWQHGSLWQVLAFQKSGLLWLWINDLKNGLPALIHTEIMFLLGLIAGKVNLFGRLNDNKTESKLISAVLVIMPFALLIKGLYCLNQMNVDILPAGVKPYEPVVFSLCNFIGTLLLAMVYLPLLFVALKNTSHRFFIWIGNAGKMALTNYLAQTVACMLLFYGYAAGLSGKVTLFQSVVLAIFIYSMQVLCSNIWLRYYTEGPIETLWKKLVYRNNHMPARDHKKKNTVSAEQPALYNAIESI